MVVFDVLDSGIVLVVDTITLLDWLARRKEASVVQLEPGANLELCTPRHAARTERRENLVRAEANAGL